MDIKEAQKIMRIQERSLRELEKQFGAIENPPSIYLEVCLNLFYFIILFGFKFV